MAAVSAPLVMHVSSSSYHILTRCGTVVALSAPLVMPLCDSHIPINVPFTFRDKQPCLIFYRARLRGGSRATASIEPLASLIRLSIMSSLERRRRRCRLLVRRLVQPKLDGEQVSARCVCVWSHACDNSYTRCTLVTSDRTSAGCDGGGKSGVHGGAGGGKGCRRDGGAGV